MSFAKFHPDGHVQNYPAAVDEQGRVVNAGFDQMEGVQKVAMMVWNPAALSWERATVTAGTGGSSGGGEVALTKRFDKPNETSFYKGEAPVGSAEDSPVWTIAKTTFNVAGDATAVLLAVGRWSERYSLAYS